MKVDGLISEIIFGPVDSRRYGRSLGINPLPAHIKLCSFNCPYCECGWTDVKASRSNNPVDYPTFEAIIGALTSFLETDRRIDAITFAGNGEPSLHPEFPRLIDATRELRDRLIPQARLVVLSNATTLDQPEILKTILKLEEPVLKLDAGSQATFEKIALPISDYQLDEIVRNIKQVPRPIIQSIFVAGRFTNTGDEELANWLEFLMEIQPRLVQIYSIDRRPANPELKKVPATELEKIAERVRERGLQAVVF